ncbi:MAG: class I SAM-dependent methyltransferase [Burkholderiales bacterium]|nr:class I SAM-dependent methyltransferase [Burkholderiales bacterium]
MRTYFSSLITAATIAAGLTGCASPARTSVVAPDYPAIVASADRSDADRKTDERRKPAELLAFTGVRPGMKVLDIGAGQGYGAELLARAVGPTGIVYAQNSQQLMDRLKGALDDRLQRLPTKNIVKVVRDNEDPVPPDGRNFDLVTLHLFYHDIANLPVDRAKMNKRIFDALKPGRLFVITDHSAPPGAGTSATKTLHRIDEEVVRREVEAAGFKLLASSDFLRNPADRRDIHFSKMEVPSDKFALKFVKP